MKRDQSIELARIVAALGVVAFHAKVPGAYIPYAGLLFFVILSPYNECRHKWDRPPDYKRISRTFLLPWAFWMFVYGVLNIATGNPLFPHGDNAAQRILAGTSLHLWFMPAMCVLIFMINGAKHTLRTQASFWLALASACVLLGGMPIWHSTLTELPAPYRQWLHAAPAALIGATLGLLPRIPHGRIPALILLPISATLALLTPDLEVGATYAIGLSFTLFALYAGRKLLPSSLNVQYLADCTLGVYLSHIVFLRIFNHITGRGEYTTAVLAFACSLAFVAILRRFLPQSRLFI